MQDVKRSAELAAKHNPDRLLVCCSLLACWLMAAAGPGPSVAADTAPVASAPAASQPAPGPAASQPAPALDTFEAREAEIWRQVDADFENLVKSNSPMRFWVAQHYLATGQREKAMRILHQALAVTRDFIRKRELANHENIGGNGFIYWAALDTYVRWHSVFDQQLLDDYRYIFTTARNYRGTTGNLSMIHTLATHLAERIYGPENLPKDARFGARGEKAVQWLSKRAENVARLGSGEFASRPYMIFNIGTLLTLDNDFSDPLLRKKAAMAYEMSIAHAAGTWLRGHWATPSGRSYPDMLTQAPTGSAHLLWAYFGGVTPKRLTEGPAIFAAANSFRPSPLIVNAATDRSKPYVNRSRFDGGYLYQTTFMNKTYAVYSTAVDPGKGIWGQTYPFGVMWEDPDPARCSQLWVTVPADDNKPLGLHTHGINGRAVQFAQYQGSFVLVTDALQQSKAAYKYVLGYVPEGYQAMVNESQASGHIFLHYGSVMIALSCTQPFDWNPASGITSGSPRKGDSEYRIVGNDIAMGLQTALPADYPGQTPAEQLAAFRQKVLSTSKLSITRKDIAPTASVPDATSPGKKPAVAPSPTPGPTATFTDHLGHTIEHTFNGPTRFNGKVEDYQSWPLLENPWMRQEFGGNLTITDGKTTRFYDVSKWEITETKN